MSTGLNIDYIKELYERMPDDELLRIATQDAAGLTDEAIGVVKAEIRRRGLPENIVSGIAAQNKTYSVAEIDHYCDMISMLRCPSCNGSTHKLNATVTGEVMSFILFTNYDKRLKIGCPACLDKANNKALTKTVLLGWWGIPWGIIHSIQSIALNLNNKYSNHSPGHNDYLRIFALNSIGELETYKNDTAKLQEIVSHANAI